MNILGNAFMFVPAGLLAPLALGWGVRRTTLAGLALSVAIEITQLMLGRSADIDDVILNSAGAAAGAAVAVAAAVLVRQRSHERQTRRPRAHTSERP